MIILLSFTFVNTFCFHTLSRFIDTLFFYFQYYFASGTVLLICWINYVYVQIVLLWKGYVLAGEIALNGIHHYYYYCQYYYLHLSIQLNDHINTNMFIFEINLFTSVLEDNHIFPFLCLHRMLSTLGTIIETLRIGSHSWLNNTFFKKSLNKNEESHIYMQSILFSIKVCGGMS